MTSEKIREVVVRYKGLLHRRKFAVRSFSNFKFVSGRDSTSVVLSHALWMIYEIEKFLDEGRLEKANRWLGFVQGCLWSAGFRRIDDLKNDNRPSGEG